MFTFGSFSLDVERRELRRGAQLVAMEPQVFDVLVHLVRNRDRVVSRDDLLDAVWSGRIVSESTLSSRINAARTAVGDNGDQQRLIRTVARKGFRFVGEVREGHDSSRAGVETPPVERDMMGAGASAGAPTPRLPNKPSIAVLAFTNMSGDPEQDYFSDGITEDIITALSRLHWFFVIARNSTFVYKGQAADVRQIGRELGVRYILEGSVRKSGDRVRVTSQLLEATTGNHIWSERYDRQLTDIFALQDEITASVAAAIEPKLLAAEGLRAETRSTEDLDAWDLVARALSHFWKLSATESAAAIMILRQAVQDYPHYAPAHSMLASVLLVSAYVGWTLPGSEREFATELAHRAVALDDSDPWAHVALGILAFTGRQTDEAIVRFKAALDLNPNFATAAGFVGFTLVLDGQSEDALGCFEQAMQMSPRDPFNSFFFAGIGAAHYHRNRYVDAIKWARQAVQLRPGYLGGHRILCASLAQAGKIEEAKAAMCALRQLKPDISIASINSVPYTERAMPKFLDGLRKAGLTE